MSKQRFGGRRVQQHQGPFYAYPPSNPTAAAKETYYTPLQPFVVPPLEEMPAWEDVQMMDVGSEPWRAVTSPSATSSMQWLIESPRPNRFDVLLENMHVPPGHLEMEYGIFSGTSSIFSLMMTGPVRWTAEVPWAMHTHYPPPMIEGVTSRVHQSQCVRWLASSMLLWLQGCATPELFYASGLVSEGYHLSVHVTLNRMVVDMQTWLPQSRTHVTWKVHLATA